MESSARYSIKLDVYDNTPSQDSSLKSLVIRDQNNKVIDFPFESDKFLYAGVDGTIHLPYKTDSITLTPTLNDSRGADTPIIITRQDATGATVGIPVEVKSGLTSEALKFDEPGKVISVFVKTRPRTLVRSIPAPISWILSGISPAPMIHSNPWGCTMPMIPPSRIT